MFEISYGYTQLTRVIYKKIKRVLVYFLLFLGSAIFLFPLLWMFITALMSPQEVFSNPPTWFPHSPQWHNFINVMKAVPFARYICNTTFVALLGSLGTTISSSLAGYSFAKLKWPGKDIFFIITLSTMMIPFAAYMIPLYLLYRRLGMIGTLLPLWLPYIFGSGFDIFLCTQFFRQIPEELISAARIDGCSEAGIFRRIIIPMSKSIVIVVFFFHFTWIWKEFLVPAVFLQKPELYTLSLGLHLLQTQGTVRTPWELLMAGCVIMSIPLILIFFFAQKSFTSGITFSGLRG